MQRRRATSLLTTALIVAALGACSSSDDGGGRANDDGGSSVDATSDPGVEETEVLSQMFASDFAPACRGNAVPGATPYDTAVPGVHKIVLMAGTSVNDVSDSFITVPQEWTILFDTESDAYAAAELVGCVIRTDATLDRECDGYEDDGVAIDKVVNLYSATYTVSVHEATTGKQLDTTTIEAPATECPLFVTFSEDEDSTDWYASDDTAVADFLAPYVQP